MREKAKWHSCRECLYFTNKLYKAEKGTTLHGHTSKRVLLWYECKKRECGFVIFAPIVNKQDLIIKHQCSLFESKEIQCSLFN